MARTVLRHSRAIAGQVIAGVNVLGRGMPDEYSQARRHDNALACAVPTLLRCVGALPTCFRREERKSLATMSSSREALALWRLALQLVGAKGVRSENHDGVATLICRTDTLTIGFTPSRDERPNGLEVWRKNGDDTGRKVLDVIWTDGTMPVVVSYHGGAWQWTLKRARF